jgi:hypothetical protein
MEPFRLQNGDTDELRYAREQGSIFAPLYDYNREQAVNLAKEGRRPVLGGLLSKEPVAGVETIRYEGLAPMLAGLLGPVARGVDAPAAAYAGTLPRGDMANEALNIAGLLQLGGAAAAGRAIGEYDPAVTRIFAGPRAATANQDMLNRAKRLAASGTDRDQIWSETGWFQLGDGQWRFEIDDRDVGLRRPGEAAQMASDMRGQAEEITEFLKNRRADLKVQPDLFPETIRKDNALLTREAERLRAEAAGNYGPDWDPTTVGQRATYALTDSELQRAYPDLMRETIVRTEQNLGGGYYGGYTQGVGLDLAPAAYIQSAQNPLYRDPRGVLLHELQHAVQGAEGFARGTNTSRAKQLLINMRDESIGKARDEYSGLFMQASSALQELAKNYEGARHMGLLEIMEDIESQAFAMPGGRELIKAGNKIAATASQIVDAPTAYDAYQRHLGELEARLVQARRDWTPEERRDVPPWWMADYIPEDRQIASFEPAPTRPKDVFSPSPPQGLLGGPR